MDSYSRTARLYPALLALLPGTVGIVVFFDLAAWVRTVVLVVVAAGLHVAVMVKVSDVGRARQDRVWARLGGNPTALRMRWATSTDDARLAEEHRRVQVMSGIELPTRGSEQADPAAAIRTYERAVRRLREKTRDVDKYPRVRAELIAYGFARNVFGLRRAGIAFAALIGMASAVTGLLGYVGFLQVDAWRPIVVSLFAVAWIGVWLFTFTGDYARRASDKYAAALLDAADLPDRSA
ncbi:hypothetical protein GCM10025783_30040 [Amnibacterium soli]|uniref:DUF2207 domain-containing protein n=1 Tax=Amnibacterium soli TaxID=1282736 RepID=A0ABP8ZEX5_9MICO